MNHAAWNASLPISPITSAIALSLLCLATVHASQEHASRILWYNKPARNWEREALPLGNGRLGCMVFGGVEKEQMQFNQDSLWIGDEKDTGAYQAFGDLFIEMPHTGAENYRRELDIGRAVHTITYERGDTKYKREYFSSCPAQVMVFRYTANKKGSYSGKVSLTDMHEAKITAEKNRITSKGDLSGYAYRGGSGRGTKNVYAIVLDYEAQLLVLNEGGTLNADNGAIAFSDCDSLTILLAAGTDYLNKRDKGWKGEHPHQRITAQLAVASKTPYDELLKDHIEDYRGLFDRLHLDLGATDDAVKKLPTDQRMAANKNKPDIDLEELLFQYARYMMISSSRPGCLPANLQGIWNRSISPPWRCDYHSDVNLQMNYWFVDQANLSECFEPLAEWIYSIREVRRNETKAHFKKRGWAMHAENGAFGGSTWKWSIGDASWLANNLWDHYAYTLDRKYLETRAYPVMQDIFMFWEDHLKEIPAPGGEGKVLVAPDGFSPEHGPHEDGVSFDQQLAWDLLSNLAEGSEALGVDEEQRNKAVSMRNRLLGPQIGKWGQLQEWMVDRDNQGDKHRHLSHMIAVHPGRQISPLTTPKLADAARASMNARGDGATGWSKAWKINIWARLHDGNRAYKLIRNLIAGGGIANNLFDLHPPFQIDGNFGYASGVCEMLVQSHMGEIQLLPALPQAWASGEVKGIRARGAFEIDMQWKSGELSSATLRSEKGGTCRLRAGKAVTVTQDGRKVKTSETKAGVIEFQTEKGKEYLIAG